MAFHSLSVPVAMASPYEPGIGEDDVVVGPILGKAGCIAFCRCSLLGYCGCRETQPQETDTKILEERKYLRLKTHLGIWKIT